MRPIENHVLEKQGMKRVAFVLKVKADKIEEYKEHHEQVWRAN